MFNKCIELVDWYTDKDGYAQINSNKYGTLRASQVAATNSLDKTPNLGLHAHHKCRTKNCAYPNHIVLVSPNNHKEFIDYTGSVYLTKKISFQVRYLLFKDFSYEKIHDNIQIDSFDSISKLTESVQIPLEVIEFIDTNILFDFISLNNIDKALAINQLEHLFDPNECMLFFDGKQEINKIVYCQVNGVQYSIVRRLLSLKCKHHLHEKDVVRHQCDNPACIRISHLTIGSQRHNMMDKCISGRQYHTEFLDNEEEYIYKLYYDHKWSYRKIASLYSDLRNIENENLKHIDHKIIIRILKDFLSLNNIEPPKSRDHKLRILDGEEEKMANMHYNEGKNYSEIGRIYSESIKNKYNIDRKISGQVIKKRITNFLNND